MAPQNRDGAGSRSRRRARSVAGARRARNRRRSRAQSLRRRASAATRASAAAASDALRSAAVSAGVATAGSIVDGSETYPTPRPRGRRRPGAAATPRRRKSGRGAAVGAAPRPTSRRRLATTARNACATGSPTPRAPDAAEERARRAALGLDRPVRGVGRRPTLKSGRVASRQRLDRDERALEAIVGRRLRPANLVDAAARSPDFFSTKRPRGRRDRDPLRPWAKAHGDLFNKFSRERPEPLPEAALGRQTNPSGAAKRGAAVPRTQGLERERARRQPPPLGGPGLPTKNTAS